jgi:hypothetical protein
MTRKKIRRKTAAKPKTGDDMRKRIRDAMWQTWQAIGADIEQARCEMQVPGSISTDELAEVICDASYLEAYGDDAEAVLFFRALPYKEQDAISLAFARTYS